MAKSTKRSLGQLTRRIVEMEELNQLTSEDGEGRQEEKHKVRWEEVRMVVDKVQL